MEFCQFEKVGTMIITTVVIRIMDRVGPSPILDVIQTITIGTMLNVYGDNNGHCLKTLRVNRP